MDQHEGGVMRDRQSIDVSIEPYEVVLGTPRLQVRARAALDPETARGALGLGTQRGTVTLSDDGHTATLVPDGELPPGPHIFTVDELITTRGRRLVDRVEVPFVVSDSRARVKPSLRIESVVRLRVEPLGTVRLPGPARPDEPFIEIMKAVDRRTGKPVEIAFDQDGSRVDTEKVFAGIVRNRQAAFGTLHPALHRAMTERRDDESLPVAAWLRLPPEDLPAKRERGATPKPPSAELERAKRAAAAAGKVMAILREHGAADPRPDPHAPVVYAELPVAAIRRLQERDDIAALFLHETAGELDLGSSMAIAQSDTVQTSLGLTGSGVNVAVYEDGPDSTADLSIVASFTSMPATSQHARHTHGIISNTAAGQPHGHAPGCNLHSANTMALEALSWAVRTRGCTVISQSFHRDAEQTDSGLSFDDMYKDWLVLHWPYPTILQAAGNGASTEYVNHKGFNSLAVGNHNDTASAMAGDSVFRNPASAHGDRESPEIAANGTSVTAVGLTMSGTSMAAPAAAGCTALLQEASRTLESWPEGCRAILLASASRNVSGATWWADRSAGVDAADGSGAVDALEGVRIANSRRPRGATATRRGWDVGTLRTGDIGTGGETTFAYQVAVPPRLFAPRVKVALAWDSLATIQDFLFFRVGWDTLQLDLDLKVYDSHGSLVGYSGSWDNSYEVAEFDARAGETYTIRIRRWSGSADVWYGLAWTVQGLPWIRPDWDLRASLGGGG
jgi:Subtilase family